MIVSITSHIGIDVHDMLDLVSQKQTGCLSLDVLPVCQRMISVKPWT